MTSGAQAGYFVFQQLGEDEWRLAGGGRPPSRRAGAQTVAGTGRARRSIAPRAARDEVFAVLQRSEWRNALDH